ncbi:hypothetical protein [Dactylosporangium sp. NPDC051484]|uniref:hypothetical protein n=1 Tax=Dactylosporangium sp. NPDC051484 TaxID=3154942 RepID=UPI003450A74E
MNQGLVYATFIEVELKSERERRTYLDSRGASLVTTSGSLVTLLAAVGAFVMRGDGYTLPALARFPLLLTLFSFVAAAAFGVTATWMHKHQVADVRDLNNMRTSHWKDDPIDSRSVVTELNVGTIGSLRRRNNRKASWLLAGLIAQVIALFGLASVIGIAVWAWSPTAVPAPSQMPSPVVVRSSTSTSSPTPHTP